MSCEIRFKNCRLEMDTPPRTPNSSSAILDSFYLIQESDLDFYELLGKGSYGCVYRAIWKSRNQKEVAVKKILQLENEVINSF